MLMNICKLIVYHNEAVMTVVFSVTLPALMGALMRHSESHPTNLLRAWGGWLASGSTCSVTIPVLSVQELHAFKKLAMIYKKIFIMLCLCISEMCSLFHLEEWEQLKYLGSRLLKMGAEEHFSTSFCTFSLRDLIKTGFPRQDTKALHFLVSICLSVVMIGNLPFWISNEVGICLLSWKCLQTSSIQLWNTQQLEQSGSDRLSGRRDMELEEAGWLTFGDCSFRVVYRKIYRECETDSCENEQCLVCISNYIMQCNRSALI